MTKLRLPDVTLVAVDTASHDLTRMALEECTTRVDFGDVLVFSDKHILPGSQWHFVEQAKELRSMAVAKIVVETEHPDARIRLRALELLGKVTEVALFTDRVEVKRTQLTDEELNEQVLQRMARVEKYMGQVEIAERAVPVENEGGAAE